MAQVVAVPSPSSAMKRRRKEEVYRLAYINCIKPKPFRKESEVIKSSHQDHLDTHTPSLPLLQPFTNTTNLPANNGCLEEKSIAQLIMDQKNQNNNPFEVVRKPPKKRKKVEESCFVNEALNLSQPEKPHNPFEVSRAAVPVATFERESHSFVNLALNLKAPEHKVINPFEIMRDPDPEQQPFEAQSQAMATGIENPALDVKIPRCIAVPFTPTINHRIDFGQLKTPEPPSQSAANNAELTPSEMLTRKLVFSPKEQNCGTPKRLFANKSLSMISEEATVDIDEELDCYQLQLENSINEAKLNNRKYFTDIRKDVLRKTVTLKEHQGMDQEELPEPTEEEENKENEAPPPVQAEAHVLEVVEPKKEDADFEEDEDSFDDDLNIDNGNYQPFKRAYVGPTTTAAKPSDLMPPPAQFMDGPGEEVKPKTEHHQDGLKGMIRRSIRMITKPKNKLKTPSASKEEINVQESKPSADGHSHHNLMSSIRRSLRKRKCRPEDYPTADLHDLSVIIDGSRSVFKDPAKMMKAPTSNPTASSSNHSVDKAAAAAAGNGHQGATSMLRNSIRRGKNNLMKNILHKKVEDYNLD